MKNILITALALLPIVSFSQVEFDPFFTYGEFEKIEDVKNLDINPNGVEYKATTDSGYKVLTTRKIYAGLGVKKLENLNDEGTLFSSVGLIPNYDTYGKWSLSFDTRDELNSFKYSLPKSVSDLDAYSVGDAIYWSTKGGIDLIVGIGSGSFSLGAKVHIDGGYSVYVQKKSEEQLYIEVRKIRTKSISLVGGTFIAFTEAKRLAEKSNGIAFTLDTSSQEGRDLYAGLVNNGRISDIQQSKKAFNKIYDVKGFKKLTSKQAALGLPIFPIIQFKREWDNQTLVDSRVSTDNFDNWYKETFSIQRNITKLFAKKTYMEKMAVLSESNSGETASLVWQKKSTRFTFNKLKRTIQKLNTRTGLRFDIDIPNLKQRIGFAKVRYELVLSESLKEAFKLKYGISSAKGLVKSLQKKWKSSFRFSTILDAVEKCGGSWKLSISGKNITTYEDKAIFNEANNCEL